MLAAEGMLKSLLAEENSESYKDSNDDIDFSTVLEFCGNDGVPKTQHEILCSDGEKRVLSFDD